MVAFGVLTPTNLRHFFSQSLLTFHGLILLPDFRFLWRGVEERLSTAKQNKTKQNKGLVNNCQSVRGKPFSVRMPESQKLCQLFNRLAKILVREEGHLGPEKLGMWCQRPVFNFAPRGEL
jgi:hypothetical protein